MDATHLAEQYADASNLSTRGEFNARYAVNDRHPHDWGFEQLSLPSDATVLDVGCGPGAFWTVNADRVPGGWSPVLADFSPGMVTEASERLFDEPVAPGFAVADGARLPFAADTFDAVLAMQMLYHLPDLDAALPDVRRVLGPDGRLYATTGSEHNAEPLFEMMSAVADGTVETIAGGFTAENGEAVLGSHFEHVERRRLENEVRVDDPDAVVAYALSLPLDDPSVSAFDPGDADALRERAADRIAADGEIRWQKDLAMFVAGTG